VCKIWVSLADFLREGRLDAGLHIAIEVCIDPELHDPLIVRELTQILGVQEVPDHVGFQEILSNLQKKMDNY